MTGSPVSTASEGGEVCPSTRAPKDLAIADKILSVRATVRTASPVRRTPAFNWWEELEESEEEVDTNKENQTEETKNSEENKDTEHESLKKEQNSIEHTPNKSEE